MSESRSPLWSGIRTPVIVGLAILAMSGPLLEVIAPASTEPADWQWPFGLLCFSPAAALILIRRPGNVVGRILAVAASGAGAIFIGGWASQTLLTGTAAIVAEHLATAGLFASFWGLISLLFVFPTGRALNRGWSVAFRGFTVFMLGVVPVLFVLRPGPMDISGRENTFAISASWLPAFLDAAVVTLPVATVAGVVSLVLRFRRSRGTERAQVKVFVLGSVPVLVLMAIISVVPEDVDPIVDLALRPLVVLGFWALPIAIVAAILRYRLYDIDRIASRTVTYLVTVVLLGFGYAGSLVTLQTLLPFEGAWPVAASTLAMAWVSVPLVRFVQRFVDRRFFRSRYDAQEVVAEFSAVARGNLDLEGLTSRLAEVVHTTLGPGHVAVWVAPADD
jgi:hypothetical protein